MRPRSYAVDEAELERLQQLEIAHWRMSAMEQPGSDSIASIVNKMGDAAVLLELLGGYGQAFERAGSILELGAGQGWASCIVKKLFPHARVTATDLSAEAIASVHTWERIFEVQLDEARACSSYDTGLADASVDLVFCFASAHHFVAHRRTLAEIARILSPSGEALYLYETASTPLFHSLAKRRLNQIRPNVPEDALVYGRIAQIARGVGLECELDFYPSLTRRGPMQTIYYAALRALPPLQRVLPCTMNFRFSRVASAPKRAT